MLKKMLGVVFAPFWSTLVAVTPRLQEASEIATGAVTSPNSYCLLLLIAASLPAVASVGRAVFLPGWSVRASYISPLPPSLSLVFIPLPLLCS